jgi:DNA transformation protein and related proteins
MQRRAQPRSTFVEHVVEMLHPLGDVSARAMFGGWGVYCDGLMFALIANDELYLKGDAQTQAEYGAASMAPFIYENPKATKRVEMSYYAATAEAMDDPSELVQWARKGLAAAARGADAKKPKKKAAKKPAAKKATAKRPAAKKAPAKKAPAKKAPARNARVI